MSYTEINQEKGMGYGGVPYDEILRKLEVTDPELVADVKGNDQLHDPGEDYKLYARAEAIDWAPDAPYLESDHARRDPALPRSMLNLRYNGGRGPNDDKLPRHPELFYGFTGNDPRGSDTQPRFDKVRGQMAARARNLQVRMGHNVGHGGSDGFVEATRPWTGMAMEYDKKEIQRRMKGYLKWFPATKVGRPWGRNVVADEFYGLRARRGVLKEGTEGLYVPEQDQPRYVYGQAGGHRDHLVGARNARARRVDRPRDADTAFWRNHKSESDLGVHKYVKTTRHGREKFDANAQGGARALVAAPDAAHGVSRRGARPGVSATELGRDMAAAARMARPNHTGAVLSGQRAQRRAAPRPHDDTQQALRSAKQSHAESANVRYSNVDAMVRSLRQGTSADFRVVQGRTVAAGKRGTAAGEKERAPGAGLRPGRDLGGVTKQTSAETHRAAAAQGLKTHNYSTKGPQDSHVVKVTSGGGFSMPGKARMGRREGASKAPEFTGHTTETSRLGDHRDRTFGSVGEYAKNYTGGLSIGKKDVTAAHLRDKGDDTLRFEDGGIKDSLAGGTEF